MSAILDFLRRLWPWRKRAPVPPPMAFPAPEPQAANVVAREPAPPPAAEPELPPEPPPEREREGEPEPEPAPPAKIPPETEGETAADDEEADEEAEQEGDDEVEDPEAPDPFISDAAPTFDPLSPEDLRKRRAEALETAMTGEHRIYFSEAAGPGTLGEALDRLLQEGRVTSEFHEGDEETGPYLLYRPLEITLSRPVDEAREDEV